MKRPNLQTGLPLNIPDSSSQPYRGKRLFDVTIALLSLLVLAPLFIVIGFAIWFNDGREH